jgi:hypothetical protein
MRIAECRGARRAPKEVWSVESETGALSFSYGGVPIRSPEKHDRPGLQGTVSQ